MVLQMKAQWSPKPTPKPQKMRPIKIMAMVSLEAAWRMAPMMNEVPAIIIDLQAGTVLRSACAGKCLRRNAKCRLHGSQPTDLDAGIAEMEAHKTLEGSNVWAMEGDQMRSDAHHVHSSLYQALGLVNAIPSFHSAPPSRLKQHAPAGC